MQDRVRSTAHRVLVGTALSVLAVACDDGPPIRPLEGVSPRVSGTLTLTPITFATTDFYIRPTKTRAEEGRLRVPESRTRGTGRTLELRFVRFAATSGASGYPTVYLAGGPGGSGIVSASGDRHALFMKLRQAGDVIALDQRGAGYGRPRPTCPGSWSYPLDRPYDEAVLSAVTAPFLRRCAEYWADSLDVGAFNTVESAEDLEDLRQALGVEKLNLWGISYGTHLALAYLRRHPNRVHRAILAGVEGPNDTWKLPANIDRIVFRLDSAIRADPRARAALPDFAGSLRRTLDRLAQAPATVRVEDPRTKRTYRVTVGPADLQRAIYFAMGERASIERVLVRLIPVFQGDLTSLGLFAVRTRLDNEELVMALSTDCASGATRDRLELIRRQAPAAVLGDIANADLRAQCAGWPTMDLGDAFRAPVRADVPVLFISGTLDARTPPVNAEEALRGLPNGRHLVIEGGSHDDDLLLSSPKIGDAVLDFLLGREVASGRIVLSPLRFKWNAIEGRLSSGRVSWWATWPPGAEVVP